jgi:hypothetical protein
LWSKLGFALQLVTVRYLGCFLAADPLAVPTEVLDVVAAQLEISDPSCVKRYTERDKTHLDHAWEIQQAFDLHDFASAEVELTAKLHAHAWNTGDGPTAIFHYAVRWLRENDVLLPGITTLTRLVARVREQAIRRLFTTLAEVPNEAQRELLDELLDVEPGGRVSRWERWRTGPVKASAPGMAAVLALVGEVATSGLRGLDVSAVPRRRLDELARYGMAARAGQLKKHPPARRYATVVATVTRLRAKTIDDALDLLDLLMVTELAGKAHQQVNKATIRRWPRFAKASSRLAAAVETLLEAAEPPLHPDPQPYRVETVEIHAQGAGGLVRAARDPRVRSLTNGIVDTTTAHGALVFGMFALMAEYEAALVRERTQAGLAAARARGRTGGRKPKMTRELINKAQRMYDARQFTMAEIATSCGVTPMTIYRNIRTGDAVTP